MRSRSVIVIQIRTKDTTQGRFVEHEHMVQALAPNRTNDALDVGPLPGGSRGTEHFLDTHVSHLSPEGIAEDRIAVAQQVARELVKGKASRSCCPVHSAVGWAVTLQCRMRRRSWASTRNTYRTWKRRVGTVRKSMETNCWA